MPKNNKERKDNCSAVGQRIFNQLEAEGLKTLWYSAEWDDKINDFIICITIDSSEEKNKHEPPDNKDFQIKYEYIDYSRFASLM